ncbi:MAG: type II toxin-antitoxin system RelE/ParE family toxin [Deltaproteobacteria bacterium]|nr:type II toxin-antitoxin system RelE/ParE family toxin [Deltaproteobacteria bacterium]
MQRRIEPIIECLGRCLVVAHAAGHCGEAAAREYLIELEREPNHRADLVKLMRLFSRLAETGSISNREHFRKVEGNIFEFKAFQRRVLGFFGNLPDGRRSFLLTNGCTKKRDDLPPEVIDRARRVMREWLEILESQR